MNTVAVAGGTGGVGETLVETLTEQSKFHVVVLSRNELKQESVTRAVSHIRIDYDDIPVLTRQLEDHNIHTIISAIGLVSEETSKAQLNLIEAADKSKVTERFIPSEYSFIQTADLLPIDPSIQFWLDAADRLKASSLKYTRVIPGFFMDYWGMPHVKTNLQPYSFGINISSRTAAIPGDGNDVICMTYTYDMAQYMVKVLDLQEWPEFSVVVGDEVTYNQILAMAEQILGEKFKVTYDSLDRIKAGNVTNPPMPSDLGCTEEELTEVTALVSRLTVKGVFDLPKENCLNSRFPEVQPITMKKFLEKAWGGNQH
ncbi:hypothetical protein N7532_009273 [Penicillium argentinense]|uniref:NmrA-like domain-containing protein n=1 Tax=Penicillium argentinense TaxID=1131581 RepID=A0A9W9EYZ0_9EURO|nr:uncharacterized protein N7532_009273 [Penicillium argentinense]KAJ5090589.1 hypothetical protein N7532_009273 [Penicillium argentinense]